MSDVNQGTRVGQADAATVLSRMVFVLEVRRDGEWHIIGQYSAHYQAQRIADDYAARGEQTRITYE